MLFFHSLVELHNMTIDIVGQENISINEYGPFPATIPSSNNFFNGN